MRKKLLALILPLSLLLCGCSLFEGSYVHVTPYMEQSDGGQAEVVSASNYRQLQSVVEAMVGQGVENGVINVADFDKDLVETHMNTVAEHIRETYPIGAYAVENIAYEVGTSSGRPAIAVTITYRHSRIEIQRIRTVRNIESAAVLIGNALDNLEPMLVLEIEEFKETDYSQIVADYGEQNPDSVMEIPQVTAASYGSGGSRVVELTFTYQTNRDSMRSMQSQVKPVFDSAALYVSGEGADIQKYSQLYGFLMERFDYTLETSITPAYSLLRHGVGDSRAFAVVYAAMCRQAGLDCRIVTGTMDGNPWVWNMVCDNGTFYHVDLLRNSQDGGFRKFTDGEMTGYVWDYSAYPACVEVFAAPETVPTVPATEPEMPTDTTENPDTEPTETLPSDTEPSIPVETIKNF